MKITTSKNKKVHGLIMKDLLQLKSYRKTLISFIVIFTIVSILQDLNGGGTDIFNILPVMITMGFGMFSIASFNYDEAAKADKYIRSLPISSKDIVWSKYLFTICATLIGAAVGILLMLILSGGYINVYENLLICLGGILGISTVEAIQIPCIYKFGAEKARMQIFLIMAILICIGALLVGGVFFWLEKWSMNEVWWYIQPLIPFIITALVVISYIISYKILYKIYIEKEF